MNWVPIDPALVAVGVRPVRSARQYPRRDATFAEVRGVGEVNSGSAVCGRGRRLNHPAARRSSRKGSFATVAGAANTVSVPGMAQSTKTSVSGSPSALSM